MSAKADTDSLNRLHAKVAQAFLKILEGGEATAAELSVMVKFLKDNNISASLIDPDNKSELEKTLAELGDIPVAGEVPEEYRSKH